MIGSKTTSSCYVGARLAQQERKRALGHGGAGGFLPAVISEMIGASGERASTNTFELGPSVK